MTIMELLMAAFIGLVVVGMVFAAVRVQGRSAAYQKGLADAQLISRGAGELLLQDLRMAGFGMLGVSPTANVPPLEMKIEGGVPTLTLRGAYDNVTTTLAGSATAGDPTIDVNAPAMGSFVAGNLVLVDSGLSSEVKEITGVTPNGGTLTLGLDSALANDYPIGPFVTQLEVVTYTWQGNVLRRNDDVVADNATVFDLDYIDQNGTLTDNPGPTVRSVVIDFQAAQATPILDNPTATSRVTTEANMRNLTFRFTLS